MTATLTFTLPEEREEHRLALAGNLYAAALQDLDQWFRTKLKHGHDFKSADEALEAARAQLCEELDSHGFRLD